MARLTVWAALAAGLIVAQPPAAADEPAFLSLAGGYFDWNRQKDEAAELRLELRSRERFLWLFQPLGGVMGTSDGAFYVFAGVGIDVFMGRRLVVTPSFAPGYYGQGGGLDLGHHVEFRSQLEVAWRFDDRSRLGLAISHMSNCGLSDDNPGTESAMLYYAIPLTRIFGE